MYNKLHELLEFESREIARSFEKARIEGYGTSQEVADRNEGYVCDFFRRYFPFPYRIVKGNIVDSYGKRSNSIDCLILNPSHPYTVDEKNSKASIVMADGVDYAIEIKSKLQSQKEICRVLEQIQSVKKLRRIRNGIIIKNRLAEEQLVCANTIPSFIFVEETYKDIALLLDKIADYYIKNEVQYIEQFDLLYINNRALVYNFRPNTYISWRNERALAYYEAGEQSLASLLLEMNKIPQSTPAISKNIMEIYLQDINPKQLSGYTEINKKLQNAKV